MRITFVLPGRPLWPVGGFKIVYEYANQLAARGHDVTLVLPRYREQLGWRILRHLPRVLYWAALQILEWRTGPTISWHPINSRVKLSFVPTLHAENVPDSDVVVATAWWTAGFVQGYPSSKGSRFYLIQGIESWGVSEQQVFQTWRYPMHKAFVGRWMYEKALRTGLGKADLAHIPNALDHSLYRVIRPIETRPLRVAMLYHTDEGKGAADGIRALELVRLRYPELSAALFGVGRRPTSLPDWIDYYRRPDPYMLVNEVYNKSAIFLCPSLAEGWGLPGAEAMACGCALVSTDNGGVRDYATHGETALLTPPGDSAAMSECIAVLINDKAYRVALARHGEEAVRQFTWERSTDLLEQWLSRSPVANLDE